MNLGDLGQQFEQNRVAILGTAAAGVVGFALYRRHAGATASPDGGPGDVSAGGQVAGMSGAGYYDSSASDVYGLVQPQLESLGQQLTGLQDKLNQVPVAAPPAVTPPKVVTPAPKPPAHAPAPPPKVPVTAHKNAVDTWVTVNSGDSLSKIAARFPAPNITWQSIYNANRSTIGGNPNLIHVGERLHVVG